MMELEDRVLLNDGTSIITPEQASEIIFEQGELPEHIKVFKSEDTESYRRFYLKDVEPPDEEPQPQPNLVFDEEVMLGLVNRLYDHKRDSDVSTVDHQTRIVTELDFFLRENAIAFLLEVKELIDTFKKESIVWGVGRGSSCASYVLYLMGVHDVNPIKYDIPFSEFSKEYE